MAMSVVHTTINGVLYYDNRDVVETEYVPDTLGSLTQCLDSSSNVTYTADYGTYREVKTSSGSKTSTSDRLGLRNCLKDWMFLLPKRTALQIVFVAILIGSLTRCTHQRASSSDNIIFDISKCGMFFVHSESSGLIAGPVLRWPKQFPIEVQGFAPIFGVSENEIFVSTTTASGGMQISHFDGNKLTALTMPPASSLDFACSFDSDERKLYFLRSKAERETSMGGVALDNIDLWSIDIISGKETQLTKLAMFSASLSPRSFYNNSIYLISHQSGHPFTELLKISLSTGKTSVLAASEQDIIGYSVSTDGKSIIYAQSSFPSFLKRIDVNGGETEILGTVQSADMLLAHKGMLYYSLSTSYGWPQIRKFDLKTKSDSLVQEY